MNSECLVITKLDIQLVLHLVVFSFVRGWANNPFVKCKMKLVCCPKLIDLLTTKGRSPQILVTIHKNCQPFTHFVFAVSLLLGRALQILSHCLRFTSSDIFLFPCLPFSSWLCSLHISAVKVVQSSNKINFMNYL